MNTLSSDQVPKLSVFDDGADLVRATQLAAAITHAYPEYLFPEDFIDRIREVGRRVRSAGGGETELREALDNLTREVRVRLPGTEPLEAGDPIDDDPDFPPEEEDDTAEPPCDSLRP